MSENKKFWVWFSLIGEVGNKKKRKLLEHFGSVENVYNADKGELQQVEEIGDKTVESILVSKNGSLLDYHLNFMERNGIDLISIFDKEYPQILREIPDPPLYLYIIGNKEILNGENVAIIGCRECTDYGEKSAKYFSYNLARSGFNIVSGLAKGVDGFSHYGALCAEKEKEKILEKSESLPNAEKSANIESSECGKTIAVLGNGLDRIYPSQNKELAKEIIKRGGAIISEYPCGTKPEKLNFVARNRIISGISKKLIVVEAKEKSGTLITVDFALEQGRDVYVVPGNINSINSVGTNDLIKQGAKIITNYEEIT